MKNYRALCIACLFFLCTAIVEAAVDDAELIVHAWSKSHSTRLMLGLATPLDDAAIKNVSNPPQALYNENLVFSEATGTSISLEHVITNMNYSRSGYQYAFALAWNDHRGDNGQAYLQALSLQTRIGFVSRWDFDHNRLFQLEVAPIFGIGIAQAKLTDNTQSNSGTYINYGLLVQGVHQFDDRWQFIYSLVWQQAEATVDWDNTGDSTVSASGINFRIGTGIRW